MFLFLSLLHYRQKARDEKLDGSGGIIATPDGQHALLVVRDAGQMVLDVSADRTKNNGEEAKMLDFFEARYG